MVLVRNPSLQARVVESETILLDRDTGYVHRLNSTASVLWAGIDGETSTEEVVESFAAKFHAETGRARRDALALIEELTELKLLHVVDR